MRFLVLRTSLYGDDTPPCDGAERGMVPVIDRRTFKSPEEHDRKLTGDKPWLALGKNHRVTPNGIERDMEPTAAWFIEIPDLAALLAFQDKHGELVLSRSWHDGQTREVEIYDDRRE